MATTICSWIRNLISIMPCPAIRFLKVWILCGYYDLATPFGSAEWVYNHVFLDAETKQNLSFTYYPSGYMFYMHEPSLAQFRKVGKAWFLGE